MKIKVTGANIFPGRFLEHAASAASDDGPTTALIANCAAGIEEVRMLIRLRQARLTGIVAVTGTESSRTEDDLVTLARREGTPIAVLRCAPVIGTGMTGRWRDMLNAIYRGIWAHVDGNNACASMIHALDLADAAVMAIGLDGLYYLSDGRQHRIDDIADALSFRLGNKRIPLLKPRQAALAAWIIDLFTAGRAGAQNRLRNDTTDSLIDPLPLLSAIGLTPRDTVEYMRTHTYTDEDL